MRKSYVQVRQDDGSYKLVPKDEYERPVNRAAFVWDDIKPYRPIAGKEAEAWFYGKGKMIDGRKQHREFLKRNGLQEVGNEKKPFIPPNRPKSDKAFEWQTPNMERLKK